MDKPKDLTSNNDLSAKRIGTRIKTVRKSRGLSRTELGLSVGLSENRIQKYENGIRKPKSDMLAKIAAALDVSPQILADPYPVDDLSLMLLLFELEDKHDLKLEEIDGNVCFHFANERLNEYLKLWYKESSRYHKHLNSTDSQQVKNATDKYNMWKWDFPRLLKDGTSSNN